jgi:hypothetical protein
MSTEREPGVRGDAEADMIRARGIEQSAAEARAEPPDPEEEMSTVQSLTAKKRWEDCASVARNYGLDKQFVHDRLYGPLKAGGLLERAVRGDQGMSDVITVLQNSVEPTRHEGWSPAPGAPPAGRCPPPSDVPPASGKSKVDRLKLALWFIEKMGGADKARKVIDLAVQVCEEME